MSLVINGLGGGQTDRQTHTHTYTYTYQYTKQSNFKKPGMHWPVAGMRLVKRYAVDVRKTD